jgi:hypothetical protein
VKDDARQLGRQRGDPRARQIFAVFPLITKRLGERLAELNVRRGKFALALMTRRNVEKRSTSGIEALALLEKRTRVGVVSALCKCAPALEERLRDELIVDRRSVRDRRRSEPRQNERCGRRPPHEGAYL